MSRNDELSRTALMPMAVYLRDLVGMVFSCFVLRVIKKCSATRGDTDYKEVFGVKKTHADGKLKESNYTPTEALVILIYRRIMVFKPWICNANNTFNPPVSLKLT